MYICIYPEVFNDNELQQRLIDEIIDFTHDVEPINSGDKIYYPGERSSQTRIKNLKEGVSVNEDIWKKIMKISEK